MYIRSFFCTILIFSCLTMLNAQSVGLVMSGGGAKGVSHIGVIKALEENNVPIDYVAGTSMGAIVAALYSMGLTPDEMLAILESEDFAEWSAGRPEKKMASYLYKKYPTSEVARLSFAMNEDDDGKRKIGIVLPTSLISSFPMDMAIVQLFASASAAAGNDFNNLMVPFFCVSADISKKKEFISTDGDLGSAVRASMTFPGYFKPIVIDSTLLFDGGLYNNFPYNEMKEIFNPDFIIGSKCSTREIVEPEEDDLFGQLELMLSVDTRYDIPEEDGILLDGEYQYGLMEFEDSREIAQMGYDIAIGNMDSILNRVERRVSPKELMKKRIAFRVKCPELVFDSVLVEGDLTLGEKTYIENTLLGDKRDTINFEKLKSGYYQLVASKTLSSVYPTASFNTDSLFTLHLQVKKKNLLTLKVGGNIASSSLTQAYLGLSYRHLARYPYSTSLDIDIGHFCQGVGVYFRQDIYDNPLVFYDIEYRYQRLNYSSSEENFIFTNFMSERMLEDDMFGTVNLGFPISASSNFLMKFGATVGYTKYQYFDSDYYSKYDIYDKTIFAYFSPRVQLEKNTLNYLNYPIEGERYNVDLRYTFGIEDYIPGSLSPDADPVEAEGKDLWSVKLSAESYYKISKWFRLGYSVDLTISRNVNMANYYSAMMVNQTYNPTIQSTTLILDKYRASSYLAVGVNPIFMITPTIYVHTSFSYFQPYQRMIRGEDGGYTYSEFFPTGSFTGNVAAVWQSPIGPVSLSCAYYDNEGSKWFPLLNIGVLLKTRKGMRN